MESSGIPIDALFGTAPLANTGPLSTSLQHPSTTAPSFEQIQGEIRFVNLSTSYMVGDYNAAMSLSKPGPVPLRIVDEMDNFFYLQNDLEQYKEFMRHFYRLYVKGVPKPLGFVHGSLIVELPWPDYWIYSSKDNSLVFAGGKNVAERIELLKQTLLDAKEKAWRAKEPDMPLDPVRHLRNEEMPVFSYDGQHVMDIDLAAAEMFGVPTYSVALIAWTYVEKQRYYWIPQLAWNNPDHPGYYVNFVSGLLRAGDNHFEHMKKLANCQARLPTEITNVGLRSCGTISYITHKHKGSFMHTVQPHVQYVYEIELDPKDHPAHSDECQAMKRYSFNSVWNLLAAGEFEPHSQMTLLAHFIRHGYVNAENEPKLQEIQTRLHRRIEIPEI